MSERSAQAVINICFVIVVAAMMGELIGLTLILAFVDIPEQNSRIFDQFVTGYWVQVAAVIGFFVGRNTSSKQNEETISRLVSNQPQPNRPGGVKVDGPATITTETKIEGANEPGEPTP